MAFRKTPAAAAVADDEQSLAVSVSAAARRAVIDIERRGRLTARSVLDAARDPESPLHSMFEWDDEKAADEWRIEQARRLIRTVKLTVEEETIVVPRYVRDTSLENGEQGYVSIGQLRTEPENAAALLRYEFSRAAAHCQRACAIADTLGIGDEARKVVASIERLLGKLQ